MTIVSPESVWHHPSTVFLSLRFPLAGSPGGLESAMTHLFGVGTYAVILALIYLFSDI